MKGRLGAELNDQMVTGFSEHSTVDARVSLLKLRVLSNIAELIGRALNLDQTLEQILELLSRELSMNRATITLRCGETSELAILASHGLSSEERSRGVYRFDEGVTGLIFSTARPFAVPDVSREPLFLNKTQARTIEKDRVAFIGVPIIVQDETVGVLSVDRLFGTDVSFEEDLQFLTVLATLVAQLISLNDQVEARELNLWRANRSLKRELSTKCESFFQIAHSPAMIEVQKLIRKVAGTGATVLLLGESGTGKTLVAQIIHELSPRAGGPFVQVNSAALPDSLLESELFGHEKGAFTGATERRIGRVEEADRGTLFLDEIGELSVTIQVKILRFLQDRELERLGSTKTRNVDARIVAATNKNLEVAVSNGSFREDLYYRLNVFPIQIPPLRERSEDTIALVDFFSRKLSRKYYCNLEFTPQALRAMREYTWPGNVRELENLMERLAILNEGNPIDLPEVLPYLGTRTAHPPVEPSGHSPLHRPDSLRDLERRRLIQALEHNNWIQARAAKELGITMRQIGYKIKRLNLADLVKERKAAQ